RFQLHHWTRSPCPDPMPCIWSVRVRCRDLSPTAAVDQQENPCLGPENNSGFDVRLGRRLCSQGASGMNILAADETDQRQEFSFSRDAHGIPQDDIIKAASLLPQQLATRYRRRLGTHHVADA